MQHLCHMRIVGWNASVGAIALAVTGAWALCGCVQPPATSPAAQPMQRAEWAFPTDWYGTWNGPIRFLGQGQRSMDVVMGLEIGPAKDQGRCAWTIVYDGSAGRQVRPYELVTVDAQAGLYQIDERNGIVLPARLVDGTLFCEFEVQGQRVAVRYERGVAADGAPVIRVEMCTTAEASATRTGGGAVPEVRGWTPQAVQRIELRRQSPAR